MKIGVFTILFNDRTLENTLDYLSEIGVETVEIGTGGYSRSTHCNPHGLLQDKPGLRQFRDLIASRNLTISALSCHGNPIHPNREIARRHHDEFVQTVQLAERLGIERIAVLSGCPGGGPKDEQPNWALCPWPADFSAILDYQWNEVLIPYWKQAAALAKEHGVTKICMEMHPGFCVYNPETLIRLRSEIGTEIGVSFDPSHLFWQGIDPAEAIMNFGEAIYHVHAKDTALHWKNIRANGVLDTKNYSHTRDRAWTFRTVGYGHGDEIWKGMISALSMVGYDGVLSIEHEDSLLSKEEGLQKAVSFLREIVIKDKPDGIWWA